MKQKVDFQRPTKKNKLKERAKKNKVIVPDAPKIAPPLEESIQQDLTLLAPLAEEIQEEAAQAESNLEEAVQEAAQAVSPQEAFKARNRSFKKIYKDLAKFHVALKAPELNLVEIFGYTTEILNLCEKLEVYTSDKISSRNRFSVRMDPVTLVDNNLKANGEVIRRSLEEKYEALQVTALQHANLPVFIERITAAFSFYKTCLVKGQKLGIDISIKDLNKHYQDQLALIYQGENVQIEEEWQPVSSGFKPERARRKTKGEKQREAKVVRRLAREEEEALRQDREDQSSSSNNQQENTQGTANQADGKKENGRTSNNQDLTNGAQTTTTTTDINTTPLGQPGKVDLVTTTSTSTTPTATLSTTTSTTTATDSAKDKLNATYFEKSIKLLKEVADKKDKKNESLDLLRNYIKETKPSEDVKKHVEAVISSVDRMKNGVTAGRVLLITLQLLIEPTKAHVEDYKKLGKEIVKAQPKSKAAQAICFAMMALGALVLTLGALMLAGTLVVAPPIGAVLVAAGSTLLLAGGIGMFSTRRTTALNNKYAEETNEKINTLAAGMTPS